VSEEGEGCGWRWSDREGERENINKKNHKQMNSE
jgi:hypothetical protein